MAGKLYGVGLGPGDPELVTLKALKAIEAADVIAYHQAAGKISHAWQIAAQFIRDDQIKLPLIYPLTRELPPENPNYQQAMEVFYNQIAAQIAQFLERGQNVSVLVAGDPLIYSSFLPIYQRLSDKYETIIIPGIISATAAAAAVGLPLCQANESFTLLSGLLAEDELLARLREAGAFALLKLSVKNFEKVRRCLQACGKEKQAFYVEAATQPQQKILPFTDVVAADIPYFSLVIVGA